MVWRRGGINDEIPKAVSNLLSTTSHSTSGEPYRNSLGMETSMDKAFI